MIDDNEEDVELTRRHLRRAGLTIESRRIDTAEDLRDALQNDKPWDAVLCDNAMPRFDAPSALAIVRESQVELAFIVVSGTVGEETAVDYMRSGAHDLVLKGNLARLVPALEREVALARERAKFALMKEQLRKSEEMLVRSERLRSLGEMAAGIAHDVRNLLNPIYLEAQIAERAYRSGNNTEWVASSLGEIKKLIGRSVETLERLRNFSRPTDTERERLDLNAIVLEACDIARPRLASRGSTCRIVEDLGSPPPVPVLPSEVLSAVVNLIINAIDAMPTGGNITLRTGKKNDAAWIAVEDDGPGMEPEVAARVFEPFFTTKGDLGTGLGLATVYGCMKQHGGDVALTTQPGQGARFVLSFPQSGKRDADSSQVLG